MGQEGAGGSGGSQPAPRGVGQPSLSTAQSGDKDGVLMQPLSLERPSQ